MFPFGFHPESTDGIAAPLASGGAEARIVSEAKLLLRKQVVQYREILAKIDDIITLLWGEMATKRGLLAKERKIRGQDRAIREARSAASYYRTPSNPARRQPLKSPRLLVLR